MYRLVLIFFVLSPQIALAHGIRLTATAGDEAFTGVATYDDGTPLVDAPIQLARINSAGGTRFVTESRLDIDGRFAFPAPRTAGEFRISVEDGLGHRGEIVVSSSAAVAKPPERSGPGIEQPVPPSKWERWASGLGYFLGLFGVAAWWLSRRQTQRSEL